MPNIKRITVDYGAKDKVVYAIIRREIDKFRLDDATGDFSANPADPYVSLTEDAVIRGRYEKDENRAVWNDGKYTVIAYEQIGGGPAPVNDTMVGSGTMFIDADLEVGLDDISNTTAAVKAKTDNLPGSPAAVGSQMDFVNAPNATAITAIQGTMQTKLDGIKTQTDKINFNVAEDVLAAISFPSGKVVGNAQNEPGYFKTNLTSAVEEFWVGGWIKFETGALAEQPPKKITHYDGTNKFITCSAFTSTPSNDDEFIIVNQ